MFAMISVCALHVALAGSHVGPPRPSSLLDDGSGVGPPRPRAPTARLVMTVAPGHDLDFTWGELSVAAVELTHREGWTLLLPVERTIALGEDELTLPVGDWSALTVLLDDPILLGLDGEERPVALRVHEIEVALDRPLRGGALELGFDGWLGAEDLRAEGETLVVDPAIRAEVVETLELGSSLLPD